MFYQFDVQLPCSRQRRVFFANSNRSGSGSVHNMPPLLIILRSVYGLMDTVPLAQS